MVALPIGVVGVSFSCLMGPTLKGVRTGSFIRGGCLVPLEFRVPLARPAHNSPSWPYRLSRVAAP